LKLEDSANERLKPPTIDARGCEQTTALNDSTRRSNAAPESPRCSPPRHHC
jgi:hypothetical protein